MVFNMSWGRLCRRRAMPVVVPIDCPVDRGGGWVPNRGILGAGAL